MADINQRHIILGDYMADINQRHIILGDYADITYEGNGSTFETYRYYLIKMDDNQDITVAQADDPKRTLILTNINSIWKIKDYTDSHTVIFTKPDIDVTQYFDRDFTQTPTKVINIASYTGQVRWKNFTELKNGIILYQIENRKALAFADPNTSKTFLDITMSTEIQANKTVKIAEDCEVMIPNDFDSYLIMNFSDSNDDSTNGNSYDDIYIWSTFTESILKLNLTKIINSKYDMDPRYQMIYPCKDKKIFCVLQDNSMYILDLITQKIINIDPSVSIDPVLQGLLQLHQLSTGEIILPKITHNYTGKLYSIDVNDGSVKKIATFNHWIYVLAVLPDDTILLLNIQSDVIYIYNFSKNQSIEIFTLDFALPTTMISFQQNLNKLISSTSSMLQNGDILFFIDKIFYLFIYAERKFINLPLLRNDPYFYTNNASHFFQQLHNGNLLINNGKYLSIVEFPLTTKAQNRKNYDEINNNITLPPDIKGLIREYL